jgi:hypothetical protein
VRVPAKPIPRFRIWRKCTWPAARAAPLGAWIKPPAARLVRLDHIDLRKCWNRNSSCAEPAEALYGIVSKHAEPEDVLYAMLNLHRKDASNAFKQALSAFGVTWERKTKTAEKVPA